MKNINLIPCATVSADTVGDLINQMRGENAVSNNQHEVSEVSMDASTNQPEKKSVIPKAVVSADTVGDLINQMRRENNTGNSQPKADEASTETSSNQPEKKSVIPKAVVSADTVGDLINQMRGENNTGNSQPKADEASTDTSANQPEKKSVIPKAVVSADSELDKLRDLLSSGRELEIDSGGRIVAVGSTSNKSALESSNSTQVKAKTIPKAVVSAPQWYETNRDLYNAEVAAMRKEFNNPTLEPKFMSDGRMYWVVNTTPNLGPGFKTMHYKLLLVYDPDHPKVRYGSSVKVYPVTPSIDDLQTIVNRLPGVSPKNIPHTLIDGSGGRYLCTADTTNVSDDLSRGVTSAVTSYRFAYRWLMIFELGIRDPKTWAKFQRHGEI